MSGDKAGENQSPEKSNSQSQQKRRITKDGPPSKAELEQRARMLDEYKRMREERRRYHYDSLSVSVKHLLIRQMFGGKVSKLENKEPMHCTSQEELMSSTECIETTADCQNEAQSAVLGVFENVLEPEDQVDEVESIEITDEHSNAEEFEEPVAEADSVETAGEHVSTENFVQAAASLEEHTAESETPMKVDAPVATINSESTATKAKPLPSWLENWKDLSFWKSNKVCIRYHVKETGAVVLKRVPMPRMRLFKLSQVELLLASGERQLAEAILSIIQAPNQLPCNKPIGKLKRLEKILARLQESSSIESIEAPPEPSIDLPKPGHFSGSDSEQDEVGSRLQMDVDEASRRHSLILSNCGTPTRKEFRSVQRAASIIMDEEMMGSIKKRLFGEKEPQSEVKSSKVRRVDVDLTQADDDDTGSTIKFAVLTPSKRIQ